MAASAPAPILWLEEIDSTNAEARRRAEAGASGPIWIAAERQTAGKGRRGRTWISPPDGNIYMSILLKPDLRPDVTPMLTVVMALSVYQATVGLVSDSNIPADHATVKRGQGSIPTDHASEEQVQVSQLPADRTSMKKDGAVPGVRFGIKWPNDIVVSVDGGSYRKVCGILTEMRMEDNEISAITIGIGLNVNQTQFDPEIAENATSYRLAAGRSVNRAALTAQIWNRFEANYRLFTQTQDFSQLRPAYEEGLVNRGRAVHVLDPRCPFTGTALGIGDRGELLVRSDVDGSVCHVSSGEVSVRGVRGYV